MDGLHKVFESQSGANFAHDAPLTIARIPERVVRARWDDHEFTRVGCQALLSKQVSKHPLLDDESFLELRVRVLRARRPPGRNAHPAFHIFAAGGGGRRQELDLLKALVQDLTHSSHRYSPP